MTPAPLTASEIAASSWLVAAEVIAHPAYLLMPPDAATAVARIASRGASLTSPHEERLLGHALDLVAEVEIRLGLEVRE